MTLELVEADESIIVGFDHVVCLFEADADLLDPVDHAALALARVVHRHGRVLGRPSKVLEGLALVHVLLDVEHDEVVEHFHLERDPFGPFRSRPADDKFELHVVRRTTGTRIDRFRVFAEREADRVPAVGGSIDGEDADKDVDGLERVGEVVRERTLLLAVLSPGRRFSVRGEDVDEERGQGGREASEQQQREEDREGFGGNPGLPQEGRPRRREA